MEEMAPKSKKYPAHMEKKAPIKGEIGPLYVITIIFDFPGGARALILLPLLFTGAHERK